MKKNIPSILKFKDYRKYLQAVYRITDTYTDLAKIMGFKTRATAYGIARGHKPLTTFRALDIAKKLGLSDHETQYLYFLAASSYAKTPSHRNFFKAQLRRTLARK